jgi:hypothetical protein
MQPDVPPWSCGHASARPSLALSKVAQQRPKWFGHDQRHDRNAARTCHYFAGTAGVIRRLRYVTAP